MQKRKLGIGRLKVSALVLGCKGMSYGKPWIPPISGLTKHNLLEENLGAVNVELN